MFVQYCSVHISVTRLRYALAVDLLFDRKVWISSFARNCHFDLFFFCALSCLYLGNIGHLVWLLISRLLWSQVLNVCLLNYSKWHVIIALILSLVSSLWICVRMIVSQQSKNREQFVFRLSVLVGFCMWVCVFGCYFFVVFFFIHTF